MDGVQDIDPHDTGSAGPKFTHGTNGAMGPPFSPEADPARAEFTAVPMQEDHTGGTTAGVGGLSDAVVVGGCIPAMDAGSAGSTEDSSEDEPTPGRADASANNEKKEPRKSTRERKPPPRDPASGWPPKKDKKLPRKRGQDWESGPSGAPGPSTEPARTSKAHFAAVVTMKSREVHMKGLPKQKQIIAQSVAKMEAVEVRAPKVSPPFTVYC